ncbi:hypothetical protein CTAYLR_004105 [Chrysophaeum taylorii]|uniref:PPPDE domain-containing protein n=1 Tax=Chrysophaeum taylorii TaxID=2483200 RepID=A0AAD7UDP5_9STRA|nr:hypothetical protein CTAYLR_004105 [Chrysophaeum taylorii]
MSIRLNVYSLQGGEASSVLLDAIGAHHSGIEVGAEEEFSFDMSGITRFTPQRTANGWVPSDSVELGSFLGTFLDIDVILSRLYAAGFRPGAYDVVRNNCNHFTRAFAQFMNLERRYPYYVNRPADMAAFVFMVEPAVSVDEEPALSSSSSSSRIGGADILAFFVCGMCRQHFRFLTEVPAAALPPPEREEEEEDEILVKAPDEMEFV